MSQRIFQSFHPQVIIVEHFDLLINQIDIKTEKMFLDQSLQEETRNKLNDLREKQIKKIDEAKEMNLNHFISAKGKRSNEEEKFREKWSHVIDDTSLEYEHKIEIIKEELILEDCVLLENPNEINGFDLWITSWFHNEKNLQFLK